jgi:hypothetical protein
MNKRTYQSIAIDVEPEFGRTASNAIYRYLGRHGIDATTEVDGYADDPSATVTVRFMGNEETFSKVERLLKSYFDFEA